MKIKNLDAAIDAYGQAAMAASQKKSKVKLLGFGAAAAGGLFAAGQADADIVYSGVINSGFNVSTVNLSSTNAITPVTFFSTGGATAFAIAGNNRGPLNAVGSTDILWGVGADYFGGYGGVRANGPAFPASVIGMATSSTVGGTGTFGTLAWAAAGLPGAGMVIDPFGVGSTGSVTGFMGFSFRTTAAAASQFGWARINITSLGGLPTSMTVIDWAYDNMGNPIHVADIPAPGALALLGLAAGAAGIRRRRQAA